MSEVIERPDNRSAVIPPKETQAATMMQVVANAASNPDCDIEKMQALLAMQDKLIEREARAEFSAAMSEACGKIPQVERTGTVSLGGKGGYKFTRWEDMDKVIRPVLSEHNLRLSFNTRSVEGSPSKVIIGTISHSNGQYQSAEIELPLDAGQGRNPLQGFGSTISYGKRYCAEMLLNIVRCDEDMDGKYQPQKQADYITAQQKEELISLLQQTRSDTSAFLAWARCRNLDEMERKNFAKARQALINKLPQGNAQ